MDSLVRECQAADRNTRTKLSALRSIANLPRLTSAAVLLILLAVATHAKSAIPTVEVPVEAWMYRYTNGAASAVATDARGNVAVTGSSGNDDSYYNSYYYTAKYAATNGAVLWEKRGPAGGANAVAVDGDGNVVVTGYSRNGRDWIPDYYTAKYAGADGSLLWEKRYAPPCCGGDVLHSALAVDKSGNVVVTGTHFSHFPFAYTAKFAAADGVLLWERSFFGEASAVTVDASGNVVVAGGAAARPEAGEGYYLNYYTAKYAAEDGALMWERRTFYKASERAYAVAVDGTGNVVVTGYLRESGDLAGDYYTAKYAASDGALLWEHRSNGPEYVIAQLGAVAVDTSSNAVVTGYSYNADGVGTTYYTAKHAASDGRLLWEKRGPGGAFAVAVDTNGNAVVIGFSVGGVNMVKYAAADGALLWEQPGLGGALALTPDGTIVVTGTSDGDFATVKYAMTQITYPTPVVLSLSLSSEGVRLRFTGDAGHTYRFQRASDPAGPWYTFANLTAPPDGAVEHFDPTPPASPAFYRIAAP